MASGTQVSRRTRRKQRALGGGTSGIRKETRQKPGASAGTGNLSSREAMSSCFLRYTGHQPSLLGTSWANHILYLRKVPLGVDGDNYVDPYLDTVQRLGDFGT